MYKDGIRIYNPLGFKFISFNGENIGFSLAQNIPTGFTDCSSGFNLTKLVV